MSILALPSTQEPRSPERDVTSLWHIVDQLPAMVSYWDTRVRCVVANKAYAAWFGTTPEQMRGRHISEYLDEDAYRRSSPFVAAALRGDEQRFERTVTDEWGRVRHSEVSYVPDLVEGRVLGAFVVVVDVTDRVESERELRRSADQYRALARSMPDSMVLLFDHDLRYRIADGPALAALGLTSADLEGKTMAAHKPNGSEELEQRYRTALSGRTTRWEHTAGAHTISFTASPVRDEDGDVFAGLVVGRDVTARRALAAITAATGTRATLDGVVDLTTDALSAVFDAANVAVARFTEGNIEMLSLVPPLPEVSKDMPVLGTSDDSALAEVGRTGVAHYVRYDAASTGRARQANDAGLSAGAAAPIYVNGALWGAISLAFTEPCEDGDDLLERLGPFADAASSSISSTLAWEALAKLAVTDELTKLPNRKAFTDELTKAILAGRREHRPLSVAIFDLDHFKAINDTHGHPAGDAVLVEATARMSGAIRRHELLARLGGEEFALLMPGASDGEALAVADRVRQAVAASPIAGLTVTVSAGTCTHIDGLTGPDLVAFADQALYAAKHAGRNRVRAWGPMI